MNQQTTEGIVLRRINYAEADRIITIITPNFGKLRLMAKAVRRVNSKLAGGIEFFSVSNISFVRGRGEIGTLTSARLINNFNNISKDVDRTMAGYQFIKTFDKVTEDQADRPWFDILEKTLIALNNSAIQLEIIQIWFGLQLLYQSGNVPELSVDIAGNKLEATKRYDFDYQKMIFRDSNNGHHSANHIKILRLNLSQSGPKPISDFSKNETIITDLLALVNTMLKAHLNT